MLFFVAIYTKFVYFAELRVRWLESVGVVSYSLYLIHFLVLEYMAQFNIFEFRVMDIFLGFIVLFAISTFTYRYIEKVGTGFAKRVSA